MRHEDSKKLFILRRATSAICRALFLSGISFAQAVAANEPAHGAFFQRQDGVKVYFSFELADTSAERSEGLMWRKRLAPRSGMLFDFERSNRIRMWMKNTLIPLDMIFINEQNKIVYVHEDAEPLSLEIIESPLDARYTVEINAGEARDYYLSVGDRLHAD